MLNYQLPISGETSWVDATTGLPPVGTLEATTGFLATLCAGCGQHLGCVRPRKRKGSDQRGTLGLLENRWNIDEYYSNEY